MELLATSYFAGRSDSAESPILAQLCSYVVPLRLSATTRPAFSVPITPPEPEFDTTAPESRVSGQDSAIEVKLTSLLKLENGVLSVAFRAFRLNPQRELRCAKRASRSFDGGES